MIDLHCHILPAMDDGSKNVEESICMLRSLSQQGIDTVVATPHFYANDESVDRFLERRQASFESLEPHLSEKMPKIMLGAEVKYYQGISRLENLKKLSIQPGKLLLLEMPMAKWTEYTVRELIDLAGSREIEIVMAHVERYLGFQKQSVLERICDSQILMQSNASYFSDFFTRRKALYMMKNGLVQFVGSDAHNMTSRAPQIQKAYEIIEKKLGSKFLSGLNEYGYSRLV